MNRCWYLNKQRQKQEIGSHICGACHSLFYSRPFSFSARVSRRHAKHDHKEKSKTCKNFFVYCFWANFMRILRERGATGKRIKGSKKRRHCSPYLWIPLTNTSNIKLSIQIQIFYSCRFFFASLFMFNGLWPPLKTFPKDPERSV